ncbi:MULTISPECIES: M35 family metallo-endopeptidase [Luteibacter]|uniref:M35 family metallo-endopeptidase n=1 Tax=Luteibacter TaxID=242605 RepID=UPI00056BE849|nr:MULTISPECIES: M35 family metallo-endopeptidase [unclassified Luteibacter]
MWDAGDFLPLHVTKAIWARVNTTDSYSCGCAAQYEKNGTAAWTEPTVTHICSWFWELPFSTYDVDNQVLTIIHENGYHADSYGPYVGDHAGAYGRRQAKAFALANREEALVNADNYAYYIEAALKKRDKGSIAPLLMADGSGDAPTVAPPTGDRKQAK